MQRRYKILGTVAALIGLLNVGAFKGTVSDLEKELKKQSSEVDAIQILCDDISKTNGARILAPLVNAVAYPFHLAVKPGVELAYDNFRKNNIIDPDFKFPRNLGLYGPETKCEGYTPQ